MKDLLMARPVQTIACAMMTSLFVLASCAPSAPAGEDAAAGSEAAMDHSDMDMETLPIEFRVAFMSGHVEAGLALYRAGAPDQAAKHLLHPVSETHAAERAGIDALGFKPDVFESVSAMLDAGEAASAIEPLLQEAEANLATMRAAAGGDTLAIIAYLMDVTEEEYAIGVTDGVITDPGEYQDAYGFSVVALKLARQMGDDTPPGLEPALLTLTTLWPETGPLADSTPTAPATVNAQIAEVRAALSPT